jgi:hypothetical protein
LSFKRTKLLKWFDFMVLHQNRTKLIIMNQTKLFQFGFKTVSYGSVWFFGIFAHPSWRLFLDHFVFLPTSVSHDLILNFHNTNYWNFNFFRNLKDREYFQLDFLLYLLDSVHLSCNLEKIILNLGYFYIYLFVNRECSLPEKATDNFQK